MSTLQLTPELGAEVKTEDNIIEQDISMDEHLDDLDIAMESFELINRIRSLRADKEVTPTARKLSNIAIGSALSRLPSCESIAANFSSDKSYDDNLNMATESIIGSIVDKIKAVFSSTDQKSGELVEQVRELYRYQQEALKDLGELGKQLEANHAELDKQREFITDRDTIANFSYIANVHNNTKIPLDYAISTIEENLDDGGTVNRLLSSCYLMLNEITDTSKQILSQKEPDERKIIDLIWDSVKTVNDNINDEWRHMSSGPNGRLDDEYEPREFTYFCKGIMVSAYKLANDRIYTIDISTKAKVESDVSILYGSVEDVAELASIVKRTDNVKHVNEIKKDLTYIENISSKFSTSVPGILNQIKDEFALKEFTKFIKQVQEFTAQSLHIAELWLYEYKVAVDLLDLHVKYYEQKLAQLQSNKSE